MTTAMGVYNRGSAGDTGCVNLDKKRILLKLSHNSLCPCGLLYIYFSGLS